MLKKSSAVKKRFQGKNRRRNILIASVIGAFLVTVAITVPVASIALKKDVQQNEETTASPPPPPSSGILVDREEWGATPPKAGILRLSAPIKRIIIAHTGGQSCSNEADCKVLVKAIQNDNAQLDDIPYNFLIGDDEKIHVGRGFEYEGQHTANVGGTEFNSIGICIAFIGNFNSIEPSERQMQSLTSFIALFLNDKIDENYKLFVQDDLTGTSIQAPRLRNAIADKFKDNFYAVQRVYRRDEWGAAAKKNERKVNKDLDWVMVSHTVSAPCSTVDSCSSYMRNLQKYAMDSVGLEDTHYNFYIGGDGLVFEGRGWDFKPEHTTKYNSQTIGVAAIGTFNSIEPSAGMVKALDRLMEDGATMGKLTSDYRVNGRSDFGEAGPGEAFMRYLREFCHYGNRTTECT